MTAVERRTSYREVLAQREFTAVLAAWLVSMLGSVLSHVALSFLVFSRTGSPFLAAVAFSIGWLPHLFVGTLLAGLPDRIPPRRLMVTCDLLSAGLVAAMALPGVPVPGLLLLVLAQGFVAPVFGAGRAATLPDLLPGDLYVVGKALLSLVSQSSQLVGYALGAVLLAVVAPTTALLIDAGSFAASALLLRLGTRERRSQRIPAASMARDSLAGLRVLLTHPRLRALLLLDWLPPMFGVIPEAVAVPYASAQGAGASAAGVLLGAGAAGVILGELVVARLLRPSVRLRWMGPLVVWVSVPLLLFALRPSVPVAAALLVASGLGWSYGLAKSQLLLDALPLELRGRGLTLAGSGAMLTQALGFAIGGAAAELLAPHDVVALGGAAGLLVTGLCLRALRRAR